MNNYEYPSLTAEENEIIRKARQANYAVFFPNDDEGDQNTLKGAQEYLKEVEKRTPNDKDSSTADNYLPSGM